MKKIISKTFLIITILSITLIAAISFMSCDDNVLKYKKSPFERGFVEHVECPPIISSFCCGYGADKTTFDIDDVTFEFYFGLDYEYELSHSNSPAGDCILMEIVVYDEEENITLVKRIEENVFTEEYGYTSTLIDTVNQIKQISFNHFEYITIPQSAFSKQSGELTIMLRSQNSEKEYRMLTSTYFRYTINGYEVILDDMFNI